MLGITNIDGGNIASSLLSISVLPLIILSIVLFIWLVKYEQHLEKLEEDPIFSVHLLKQRQFQVTLVLGLFSGGFLAGIIFIPSYVQQVLHVPVESAGFMTSSVLKVEPILLKEYGEIAKEIVHNKGAEASESFSLIMHNIKQLSDMSLQVEMIQTVTTIFKAGYNQMFYTSATLAFFVLLLGVYLLRRKN